MAENQLVTLCTVPDRESGEKLARTLVEEHLAACVNLVPGVVSTYRWEGEVKTDAECLLVIKTTGARFEALKNRILALHTYDTPEIIAVPITAGSEEYLKWITESTR